MATNRPYIHLSDIPKNKHPFSVPDGYFQNLSEAIDSRIHPNDEPELILTSNHENSFTIPDNYFNTLAADIQKKTQAIEAQPRTSNKNNHNKLWIITGSMAAAIALLLAFSGIFKEHTENGCSDPLACLEVTEAEFNSYVESEVILDEDLLVEQDIIESALLSDESIPLDDFIEETLPSALENVEPLSSQQKTAIDIPSELDFDFEVTENDIENFDYDY